MERRPQRRLLARQPAAAVSCRSIIDPEYHYETVNVEAQQSNSESLLWWMKRLIALRKRYEAFGRGTLEFLHPENRQGAGLPAPRRRTSCVLVVANLSRFAQYVELDLSRFRGLVPVELFGQTPFPPIGELPYLLTLGPHAFYWFSLEGPSEEIDLASADDEAPLLSMDASIDSILGGRGRAELERAITRFLPTRRWFAGKARTIRLVSVIDSLPLTGVRSSIPARVLITRVEFTEGEAETYSVLLTIMEGERADYLVADSPRSVVARLPRRGETAVLADALVDPDVCKALLEAVRRRRTLKGHDGGRLIGRPAPALRRALGTQESPEPSVFRAEQSNTSVLFGESLILKLFRRVEAGVNPDLELGRFLTDRTSFENTPAVAGSLEYDVNGGESITLAVLHDFVPNEGDAWQYTLDALSRYYEWVVTERIQNGEPPPEPPRRGLLERALRPVTTEGSELVGSYLQSAQLMGQRIAEMHVAFAGETLDPGLVPEPFTPHYQRSVYQSMRNLSGRALQLLRTSLPRLSDRAREDAEFLLGSEKVLLERFGTITAGPLSAMRIRCHGDLHLGQMLFTGRDFMVIDFEGEPARSLSDRRVKRSSLRDVAGLLRSFHYATFTALLDQSARGLVERDSEAAHQLELWGRAWNDAVSSAFLGAYLEASEGGAWLPDSRADLRVLLDTSLLEKAVYELTYELNNRPLWVPIALMGLKDLVLET